MTQNQIKQVSFAYLLALEMWDESDMEEEIYFNSILSNLGVECGLCRAFYTHFHKSYTETSQWLSIKGFFVAKAGWYRTKQGLQSRSDFLLKQIK